MTETPVSREAPDLISAGAEGIQDRAQHLGLTWGLRPATVNSVALNSVLATYDGDTVPIGMVSMIGTLTTGARVYVLQVPPSGNFIVGQVRAYESGDESFTFTTQTSQTRAVTFTNPFLLVPRVFTNINSGAGVTQNWFSRAFNVSTTGFTLWIHGPSATWGGVHVYWAAFAE